MSRYKRPESVLVVVYTAAGEVLLLRRQPAAGFLAVGDRQPALGGNRSAGRGAAGAVRRNRSGRGGR
ncbi:MAG: hypothetical protein MZV65_14075 [Chromatiales bacterium]|nr:hypothetical protein [Chromatiales bacterium]